MNALIFIYDNNNKARHFPNTLPISVLYLIPNKIPEVGYSIDDCSAWVENYNTIVYRSSIFINARTFNCCNKRKRRNNVSGNSPFKGGKGGSEVDFHFFLNRGEWQLPLTFFGMKKHCF